MVERFRNWASQITKQDIIDIVDYFDIDDWLKTTLKFFLIGCAMIAAAVILVGILAFASSFGAVGMLAGFVVIILILSAGFAAISVWG